MCYSREQAEQVKQRLAEWLEDRGLSFNEDKTRIVHADDGCDFLGFTIRRFGGKLLIKPSKAAVKRFRERLTAEMRALRGSNAMAVITTLNPIIRGWAAYYRGVVSKEVFSTVDQHLWQLTYRWALRSHPNKPKHWVIDRYFGEFNPFRSNRWVFGDRDSGAYLRRLDWTRIVRHQMVLGTASPDDPSLADYWTERRRKRPLPLSTPAQRLLQAQHGRCPACGEMLLAAAHEPQNPHQWEQWIKTTRKAVRMKALTVSRADGPGERPDIDPTNQQLLHERCARQAERSRRARAAQNPGMPPGLA